MVVCLVEDDATVLSLLAELLQRHGHDPRSVLISNSDTVKTGLDRMAASSATVIVMDLGMPVHGLDLLDASRKDARFTNVRYVVATASFDGLKHLPKSPDIVHVAKPYDFDELLAALEGRAK